MDTNKIIVTSYEKVKQIVDNSDFDYFSGDDYASPEALALYQALEANNEDSELVLGKMANGKMLLAGFSVSGHYVAYYE